MSVSICIPCYEMHGKGVEYLNILLKSILNQECQQYEVIISDQSQNDDIYNVFLQYKNIMDISYSKCEEKGKSSYNLNNAISKSKYSIIKPMFQDDFFIDTMCLDEISKTKHMWGGVGFTHFDDKGNHQGNTMLPRYNINIKNGVNTFGSPSVCFFRKDENYFNNDLVWLMDCEFYEHMFRKYKFPYVINKISVGIRIWGDSYSYHISDDIKHKEEEIVKGLYA
jgi:glycosyltransferase involved in cell wall biosynthesis